MNILTWFRNWRKRKSEKRRLKEQAEFDGRWFDDGKYKFYRQSSNDCVPDDTAIPPIFTANPNLATNSLVTGIVAYSAIKHMAEESVQKQQTEDVSSSPSIFESSTLSFEPDKPVVAEVSSSSTDFSSISDSSSSSDYSSDSSSSSSSSDSLSSSTLSDS